MKPSWWVLSEPREQAQPKRRYTVCLHRKHSEALRQLAKDRPFADVVYDYLDHKFPRQWDSEARLDQTDMHMTISLTQDQAVAINERGHSVQNFARLAIEHAAGWPMNYAPEELHFTKRVEAGISFDADMDQQWRDLVEHFPDSAAQRMRDITGIITPKVVWDYGKPINPQRPKIVARRSLRFPDPFPTPTVKCFRAGLRASWHASFPDGLKTKPSR